MSGDNNDQNQFDLRSFQVLFDRSLDGMLFIEDGKFVKCNLAAAKMLGYDDTAYLLKAHPSKLSPLTQPDGVDSEKKADQLMQIALEKGQHSFEWLHQKVDGKAIWIEVSLTSIATDEHQLIHVTWHNIHAKKEAEAELLNSKTQMEEIIYNFPIAIVRAEIDNASVGYFNQQFHNLFGWRLEEINTMEKWFTKAYPDPNYRNHIITEWGKVIEHTHKLGLVTAPYAVPSNVTCQDGKIKICEVWYHSTAGNVFGIFHDITAQKSAEKKVKARTEELALANAAKDKFFSIIAHDLRGPIGSLSVIFNNMIKKSTDLDENLLEAVRKSTKNTYGLLEDLLTWSQNQKGEITVDPTDLSISRVIDGVFGVLRGSATHKKISLRMLGLENEFVFADFSMITTVARNLINNAIKFTAYGGVIEVSCLDKGHHIQITVTDNGVGISPERLSRLFNLGEKTHSTLGTSSESGTGLGLILSAEFVAKNGGMIGVESELGKGSRFWFTLPKGKEVHDLPAQDEGLLLSQLSKLRVLVAEDNPLHQETTASVLKELGVDFNMVQNGALAVQAAKSDHYDLVLMDIDMPELNGIEATDLLRQSPPRKKQVWILALSSYSKRELEGLAKNTPFEGYINKPLAKIDFLNQLRPLLLPTSK
ncbi:MAG: ATP-binding protein [SAR324 cluster bacterium]|nr:ATP-binding protein [SAR324 cluster bacterium]